MNKKETKELKSYYRDEIKNLTEVIRLNPYISWIKEWQEDGSLFCYLKKEPNRSLQYVLKSLKSELKKMEVKK